MRRDGTPIPHPTESRLDVEGIAYAGKSIARPSRSQSGPKCLVSVCLDTDVAGVFNPSLKAAIHVRPTVLGYAPMWDGNAAIHRHANAGDVLCRRRREEDCDLCRILGLGQSPEGN